MLFYHPDKVNEAILPPMTHKNHLLHPLASAIGFFMTLVFVPKESFFKIKSFLTSI